MKLACIGRCGFGGRRANATNIGGHEFYTSKDTGTLPATDLGVWVFGGDPPVLQSDNVQIRQRRSGRTLGGIGLSRELMNDRLYLGYRCNGRFPIFAPYSCTYLINPGVLLIEATLLAVFAKVVHECVLHGSSHFLAEGGQKV